jgi:anti-sigma factor ChrR (cupin superfamily)
MDGELRDLKHEHLTEEHQEQAALYALGALDPSDAREFEAHLAAGCAACAEELKTFKTVVADFGLSAGEAAPPASAREKLLASLATEPSALRSRAAVPAASAAAQFLTIRADQGEWQEVSAGVLVKKLFEDRARGTVTALIKLLPGAQVALHRHPGAEECIVLSGDFHVNGEVLGPGDYHCALPGSTHEKISTEQGTILLIVAPESYEMVETP